jgi:tol-pal system protein YbgF
MRGLVLAVLGGIALLLPIGAARAQDSDVRPLMERLDRLERDMNMLQRQVYRGSGAPITVGPGDSQAALSNEVRIGQIEEQMRTLNGQLEQANYAIDQLRRRLEKLSSDIDLRLTQLEHGGNGGAPSAGADQAPMDQPADNSYPAYPPPPPLTPPPGARGQQYSLNGGGGPQVRTGPQPGILGTLPTGPNAPPPPANGLPPGGLPQTASAAPPPGLPAPAGGALPNGTPRQQFDYAFGLLRQANYVAAEQALRAFIQRYPNDELAGNAQYWLGKTYYVREDYSNAAVAFAEGYKRYPKSGKAQDNLLDLGMSLANLKRTEEACLAFARFERDFPNAPPNSKEQVVTEKKRLGCKLG